MAPLTIVVTEGLQAFQESFHLGRLGGSLPLSTPSPQAYSPLESIQFLGPGGSLGLYFKQCHQEF